MTSDAAVDVAVSDAGFTVNDVQVTKSSFQVDDGNGEYEVEFYRNNVEYDYTIDARSGAILERSSEAFKKSASSQSASASTTSSANGVLSADAVKAIAAEHAGLSAQKVTFTQVKLEVDDGVQVYDVSFINNNIEYDYQINATTGAILEFEADR